MERKERERLIRARRNGVRRTRRIWYLAFSTTRKINASWNSSSRQETTLRNFKSAGAIVFHPISSPGLEEKEITGSPEHAFPPDFFTILRVSRVCMPSVWNASVRCQEIFSSQHVHKNRRISRRCRLLPVGVSNSAVRVPPGNVNSTRPINFASRLFARSRVGQHLLRAPVRTRSFPLFPLTHACSTPIRTAFQWILPRRWLVVPLDILSRIRPRSRSRSLDLSPVIAVSSFLFHGLSTRCSCSILVSFTTEEVTRPLGCAQTPETPHTYRTNESFIIGRALKKFLRARGGSGERSD